MFEMGVVLKKITIRVKWYTKAAKQGYSKLRITYYIPLKAIRIINGNQVVHKAAEQGNVKPSTIWECLKV